ncbi:titin homolog [Eupeodes corollae]|uniref:titin homolog n=1 Tax=Eupeodes corollae TaxID=290404 RepID=UPI00248FEC6F|nr:titin homolog [Eupeodes corollae]
MKNPVVILVLCLCSLTNAVPLGLKKNMAIIQEQEDPMLMMATDEETRPELMISRLNLPSNATSIRADITDGFSCDNKTYGYYADVENECQIFHVCLPVTYADGKENTFRWSFICPEETVFSQEYFTCMRSEDMSIDCEESFKYYELNRNFGMIEPEEVPADEDEEEMNMEEMSRQPSLGEEETNKPSVEGVPVKKQTVKVQNSNRRKTQANRVTIEAQRKKVQPLRRLPKPVVTTTTTKPIVEESPIVEQEVERTTIKYQRLTKRPSIAAVIPEQPKPEEQKVEKEVVRQDLFAQKRKRPQIFFPSRFDTSVQADSESKPLPYLKTDIFLQKPEPEPETVVQNQAAESQAQASEINVVSVKPHDVLKPVLSEKVDAVSIEKKAPAAPVFVPIKEETQPIIEEHKSEIASLPVNIPSRVEVVEIPIQKIDEPVVAEGSAVLAKTPEVPAPQESKPIVSVSEESIKTEEVQLPAEESLLKKIIAQAAEKIVESEKPSSDEEKTSVLDSELAPLDEPEESLQNLKSVDLPKPTEPEKTVETITETKVQEQASSSDEIPSLEKSEESVDEVKPEVLLKVETPAVFEKKPEEVFIDSKLKDLSKPIVSVEESALVEDQTPEKPEEAQTVLKFNAPEPEILEPEVEKPKDITENEKLEVTEPEILEAQPEKLIEVETSASEPQVVPKSEISEVKPVEPIVEEAPVSPDMPLKDETPIVPAQPTVVEISDPQVAPQNLVEEFTQSEEKPAEVEASSSNEEVAKVVESIPEVKLELPVDTSSKPLESLIEPVKEVSPQELFSSEVQAEKSSEVLAEEKIPEVQFSESEKEATQAATDNEEAQSLILDFISSLVNSENSNFDDQSAIIKEMSSDSLPEASIPEPVVAEVEPEAEPEQAKIQSQDDQINPLYIPMMPSNEQMYQIPVQVIETPEPESVPAVSVPVAAEPKLPLSVDDVVELVKESLDAPSEKESLVQEPSNDDPISQPDSEEVKPIYHRYIELGSNLLKSEALTASDDEPVVVPTVNEDTIAEKQEASPELPKTSEKLAEPETLASKPNASSEVHAVESEKLAVVEDKPDSQLLIESPKEGRSLNRFKMDPRKRRFLFRSDAS